MLRLPVDVEWVGQAGYMQFAAWLQPACSSNYVHLGVRVHLCTSAPHCRHLHRHLHKQAQNRNLCSLGHFYSTTSVPASSGEKLPKCSREKELITFLNPVIVFALKYSLYPRQREKEKEKGREGVWVHVCRHTCI